MFDNFDSDDAQDKGFKINKDFAAKYEHNAKRDELGRLEQKYGKAGQAGDN